MIVKHRVPLRYIFKEIRVPLLVVALIGIAVHYLQIIFSDNMPDITISIATTLGIAISILVSFKVNQSYDRWWEARKIWGAIVNDSRTLVLQLRMYVSDDHVLIKTMAYRQIAWCYALGQSLRGKDPFENITGLISEKEFKIINGHKNVPLAIIGLQVDSVKKLFKEEELDRFSRLQLEETLERLTASMGKCERIKNTVFPTTYRQGLHMAIYLFVIFLSLSEPFKMHVVFEVLTLVIVSMVFFFLEKAAFRIQDPFENYPTDTPMTSISRTIDINIRQLLGETELPESIEPKGYYIM